MRNTFKVLFYVNSSKEKNNPEKLHLSLNGQNIINWFKQKYQEIRQAMKPHISPIALKEKRGRAI